MGRHVFYTKITPLPDNIPRLLALDLLHSHDEFIKLNPLVTEVKAIDAPRDAEGDEFFSNWYRIHEIMKLTGVKIKYDFKGCFHNQQWGMQSHIIGPAGIEMRNKYRIGGNQPGEPREARELGVKTPMDGLYLREDISFTCSAFFAGIVKKGMQDASQVMIDRMKRKAELLDQGKIHAMFEDGKLKTSKPTGPQPVMEDGERSVPSPGTSQPGSPPPQFDSPYSQNAETFKPAFTNYGSLVGRHTSQSARASFIQPNQQYGNAGYNGQQRPMSDMPGYAGQQYQQYPQDQNQNQSQQGGQQQNFISELPGNFYQPQNAEGLYPQPLKPQNPQQSFRSELPGDNTLYPESANRRSSPQPGSGYPNQGGQQSPGYQNQSGQASPGYQNQGGSAENSARSSSYQLHNPDQPQQNRSSSYQVTNPEQQQTAAGARQSSQSNIAQWQQSVQNDAPIDESYYRNSRHSHGGSQNYSPQPDHQRMSNLSVSQNASDDRDALPSQRTSKCPVCGIFEGDETAVSHHVAKAHFE